MNEEKLVSAQNEGGEQEKTFSQADVDRIVQDRVGRERAKYADFDAYKQKAEKFDELEEAQKSELQKANERAESLQKQVDALNRAESVRKVREAVASETNVPIALLTGEDEETCRAQAQAALEFAKPSGNYPAVKDSGETTNGVTTGGKTRDQFAEWFGEALNNH